MKRPIFLSGVSCYISTATEIAQSRPKAAFKITVIAFSFLIFLGPVARPSGLIMIQACQPWKRMPHLRTGAAARYHRDLASPNQNFILAIHRASMRVTHSMS